MIWDETIMKSSIEKLKLGFERGFEVRKFTKEDVYGRFNNIHLKSIFIVW